MKSNFIYRHIRQSGVYGILLSILISLVIIALFNSIPFGKVFFPSSLSYANRAADVYASGNEYVELTLNNAHYTGYDCYRHGKVYASYYYSLSKTTCTLTLVKNEDGKLPDVLNNYTITARLVKNDKLTDNVIEMLSKDLDWNEDGLRSVMSSVTIDETAYKYNVYLYLAVALGIISLIIASYFISNIVYIAFPAFHPSCIYFRRLSGNRNTISHVNSEISSNVIMKSDSIILTEHYIVCHNPFNIEVVPLDKIIWAYEHSRWQHFLFFKTRLNYTLSIVYGNRLHIDSPQNTKDDIDTILAYLKKFYPDIIIGYTPENKLEAKKRVSSVLKQIKAVTKKDRLS